MNPKKLQPYLPFIVFAAVIFIAVFTLEKINGRFWLNDFRVYYSAAQALINHQQVYGTPFGLDTGFYKYSPFVAILFVPYTFFSFETAAVIHFTILCAATILTIILLGRLMNRYFAPVKVKTENALMSFGLLCILLHLVRELHLGNINMLLLLLSTAGILFSLQSKNILSGICVGLAVIIKPYLLVLVLPFIASGKWRTLASIILTVIFSLLLPMLFFGFAENILLHTEWVDSMRMHGSYLSSNNTFQSLLQYYFGMQTGIRFTYFLIAIICTGYFFIFTFLRSKQELPGQFFFVSGFFCLLSIVPNIVITDTEHFLLSLPLIMILLRYVIERKNLWVTAALIVVLFFYEGNSTDLLGKSISARFAEMGLLGISNLIIIASVLMLCLNRVNNSTRNRQA